MAGERLSEACRRCGAPGRHRVENELLMVAVGIAEPFVLCDRCKNDLLDLTDMRPAMLVPDWTRGLAGSGRNWMARL